MSMQPNEWRKSFQNKTESELETLIPPPGLPPASLNLWYRDRDDALALVLPPADEDEDEAWDSKFSKQKQALEASLSQLENDTSQKGASTRALPAQPSLEIPDGNAADLLERQIGTCAALIGNIANHIARNDTPTDVCFPFMDRIASLLSSSATAARVVGQLRGIPTETKQTFVTEKGGKGAGGVQQT